MSIQHEDAYLESRIFAATPAELVQILYEAALDSVRQGIAAARSAELSDAERIAERARAVSRASSCVMELAGALNVEVGGTLSVRLAVLYEYLLHELLEASAQASELSLRNCEGVLAALLDGWSRALDQMDPAAVATAGQATTQATPVAWRQTSEGSAAGDNEPEYGEYAEVERGSWCA